MKNKYVIFGKGPTGFDGMIFPNYIKHKDFANRFPDWEPMSAGFIEIKDNKVICSGESVSLEIKSNEADHLAFKHLVAKF